MALQTLNEARAGFGGAAVESVHVLRGRWGVLVVAAAVAAGGFADLGRAAPTPSVAPSVTGIARQGDRLLAAAGVWSGAGTVSYRFQWYRCNALGARCSSISGATAASYRAGERDVGATIGLSVRATDSTGAAVGHAGLVGPVVASGSPVARVQPAITGTAAVGQRLTVRPGTWTSNAGSFAYAWLRCNAHGRVCVAISGATGASYTVADADRGRALVARVTGTVGTARVTSLSTRMVVPATTGPTATTAPSVAGVARRGQRLTAARGVWTGTGAISYRFQWYRCNALGARCSSISGATAEGYRLAARDVGATIGLTVRVTDATGTTVAHASLVGPIARAAPALAARQQPALAGTPAPAQTLTVGKGTWSATPASFAYAWLRCNENGRVCAPIAGATANRYTPTDADRGHALVARVTARLGSRAHATLSTRALVPKPTGPLASVLPGVEGTVRVGQRLVAQAGTWSGAGTISYRFQWYRCNALGAQCSSVSGATAAGYRLTARDAGRTIGLTVRATDSTGTTIAFASLAGPVAPAAGLAATVQPAVTGVAALGGRLTAGTGTWTAAPTAYAYAWLRCNENGRACVPITGATAATYIAGEADRGRALIARVTATAGTATQETYSTRVYVAR